MNQNHSSSNNSNLRGGGNGMRPSVPRVISADKRFSSKAHTGGGFASGRGLVLDSSTPGESFLRRSGALGNSMFVPRASTASSIGSSSRPTSFLKSNSPSSVLLASNTSQIVDSAPIPPDGVIFAQLKGVPSSLVVYRSPAAREASPERLNLDRRKLTQCPILEKEERIRLLNYQNNRIREISNLRGLGNLIFLDLYNNHITEITNELSHARTLRVLMLGKNRISKITCLERLTKLDVLDLHSNFIVQMNNLSTLTELRVLNLAGNQIETVENIRCLQSLTELNLRRNEITMVYELHLLPSLQRVFLSNNKVTKFEDVGCLFKVKFLMELTLDGNPIAGNGSSNSSDGNGDDRSDGKDEENDPTMPSAAVLYRAYFIERIKTLRHFDLKRVTDDERRHAIVLKKRQQERAKQKNKKLDRKQAIRATERAWAKRGERNDNHTSDRAKGGSPVSEAGIGTSDVVEKGGDAAGKALSVSTASQSSGPKEPATETPTFVDNHSPIKLSPSSHQEELQNLQTVLITQRKGWKTIFSSLKNGKKSQQPPTNKGYYEVEGPANEDERVLRVYGSSFEFLNNSDVYNCSEITFNYVDVEAIVRKASDILKKFRFLKRIILRNNAVKSLAMVAKLVVFYPPGQEILNELCISYEGNPVVGISLFRFFAAYMFPHLKFLNLAEITEVERSRGAGLFGEMRKTNFDREMSSTAIFKNGGNGAYGLTDSLSSKTIDALGVIYDDCSKAATSASQLGREFEELWPGIVNDLVKKTLNDMENEEAFMDRCLWYI